ncbi:hypothetical protein SEA_ZIKO_124 [Gordonia phage Ziko]|uniref:Uncharacterized protein n=1 Tax=Gordonia phage Ziko TaxID=2591193 RepID=A0A514A5D5_9CAUD|nr:hypothetical protein SEA_ZIKO_124 [Gordonia phage Ziko]
MTLLNQIIAIDKGERSKARSVETKAYQTFGKSGLLQGISRTYQPLNEDDVELPPESTKVQVKVPNVIEDVKAALTRAFDVVLTKESANGSATADIVVGDETIAEKVPVTYLLFLEKELENLFTFAKAIPRLDPSEDWTYDENVGAYASQVVQTTRTRKVPRHYELSPATKEHKAQVEMYYEDKVVGTWSTRKFSGAMPSDEVDAIVHRIEDLQRAVKQAREKANSTAVEDKKIGDSILNYVFG